MRTEQITDFYRPQLDKTAKRDVKPIHYIQEWMDDLRALKESIEGEDGSPLNKANDFYRLLVRYGRLRRISEKFHDDNLIPLMDWAREKYHGLKPEDFEGALACFDPGQWLEEADQVSQAWEEEEIEAVEARRCAVALFTAYDDINLCVELAWEKLDDCRFVDDYHEQLSPCYQWVREDRYLVELASLWYQTYTAMFNENNEDCRCQSMTLLHFVLQLDKLQDTWEYMNSPIFVLSDINDEPRVPPTVIKKPPYEIIFTGELVLGADGVLALQCGAEEDDRKHSIKIKMRYEDFEFTTLIYSSKQHIDISLLEIEGKSDELQGCNIQLTLNGQPFESTGSFEKDGDRYVCAGYVELNFLTLAGDYEHIKISDIKVYHE